MKPTYWTITVLWVAAYATGAVLGANHMFNFGSGLLVGAAFSLYTLIVTKEQK